MGSQVRSWVLAMSKENSYDYISKQNSSLKEHITDYFGSPVINTLSTKHAGLMNVNNMTEYNHIESWNDFIEISKFPK